ncbi:hypothetical protein HD554DRAFT_2165603 [Boletus coccyginus]|nr:hypothetical protein HD554DRAFT_2165603 [Boletus coccyginus]
MSLTVESIKAQEEACVLPAFDSDVAWELGTIIRTRCQQNQDRLAVIYIAHANSSQLLFFTTSRPGTFPDNVHWVKREEAVYYPRKPMRDTLRDVYGIADPAMYACQGGGFPVRVKNVEGIVGVIVVNGLSQNHDVIMDSIKEYLARHE